MTAPRYRCTSCGNLTRFDVTTSRRTLEDDPQLVDAVVAATRRGYEFAERDPAAALDDLLEGDKSLERADQEAQLEVLLPDLHPKPFDPAILRAWAAWDLRHGLLERPLDVSRAFRLSR